MANNQAAPKTQPSPTTQRSAKVRQPIPSPDLTTATASLATRGQATTAFNPHAPVAIVYELDGKLDQRMIGQNLPKNATPVGVVTQDGAIQVGYSGKYEVTNTQVVAFGQVALVTDADEGYLALWDTFLGFASKPLADTPTEFHSSQWAIHLVLSFDRQDRVNLVTSHQGNVTGTVADVLTDVNRWSALDLAAWLVANITTMTSPEEYAACGELLANCPNWFRVFCISVAPGSAQMALIEHLKAIPEVPV